MLTTGSDLTDRAAAAELRQLRSRGRWRGVVALLGPAFVAAIAYVDPGNFATSFSAGASFRSRRAPGRC
jgi:manganese transport protein